MPGRGAQRSRDARRLRLIRLGAIALAAGWILCALALAAGGSQALAHPLAGINIPAATTTGTPPTGTPPTDTPSATDTPAATATRAATATTVQDTPTPTDTPAAQPTRAIFSQPTLGSSSGPGASASSSGNLTSFGMVIFTTLGCIFGVIGLLTLAGTGLALTSEGSGPLIKAVLLGNRRGRLRFDRQPSELVSAERPAIGRFPDDWR